MEFRIGAAAPHYSLLRSACTKIGWFYSVVFFKLQFCSCGYELTMTILFYCCHKNACHKSGAGFSTFYPF